LAPEYRFMSFADEQYRLRLEVRARGIMAAEGEALGR
jgi:PHD/YefM family antitoxin component YafN of YafNO toxin-antitoxin module